MNYAYQIAIYIACRLIISRIIISNTCKKFSDYNVEQAYCGNIPRHLINPDVIKVLLINKVNEDSTIRAIKYKRGIHY